jgi:para-aminobenzoate synthetase component I
VAAGVGAANLVISAVSHDNVVMPTPLMQELSYHEDSSRIFETIRDHDWPIWLDSGAPYTDQGQFDIIVADPIATLVSRGVVTEIRRGDEVTQSQDNPLNLLRPWLNADVNALPNIPFAGGALGYFGYDLARRLERLPSIASDVENVPDMAIGIYDWAVVVDHHAKTSRVVSHGASTMTTKRWEELAWLFKGDADSRWTVPFHLLSDVEPNVNLAHYADRFARLKRYIADGDCYQVNLTRRFSARAGGDPWTAYRALRKINPAPMAAYLQLPFVQIMSSSPEGFLHVQDRNVSTKPIKGTRPRHHDASLDEQEIIVLRGSTKDQAENVMIVDLLRNDLGKVCETGSVTVPKLFEIETFAMVHHLVSTVTGRLRDNADTIDLLQACFPGGSITGAPKLRAMEIIEELEPNRRGIYCGSIGYIGDDGALDLNIAIRTLVYADGEIRFWVGGGIVADSEMEDEFQETLDKAKAMLRMLHHEPQVHTSRRR